MLCLKIKASTTLPQLRDHATRRVTLDHVENPRSTHNPILAFSGSCKTLPMMSSRNLTLTEELEKLEQSITLTLQGPDAYSSHSASRKTGQAARAE